MAEKTVLEAGMKIPDVPAKLLDGGTSTTCQLTEGKNTLLFFLRDSACVLCMEKMDELCREYDAIKENGYSLLACVSSDVESAVKNLAADIAFPVICDKEAVCYDAFGVYPVEKQEDMEGPGTMPAIQAAKDKGFLHGVDSGSGLQLPAVFKIGPDGVIGYVYYGKTAEDLPQVESLF